MTNVRQVDFPKSSATFEFSSKFPDLHMPTLKAAQKYMVDPRKDECLFDGEIVQQAADGMRAETLKDAGTIIPSLCFIMHGKPGRSDIQVAQAFPVVKDTDFHFRTKLVEAGATPGTYYKPAVLTSATSFENHGGLAEAEAGEEYVAVLERDEGDGWFQFRFQRGSVPA